MTVVQEVAALKTSSWARWRVCSVRSLLEVMAGTVVIKVSKHRHCVLASWYA